MSLLLPAFYAVLDPTRIPSIAELDVSISILSGSAPGPAIATAIGSLSVFVALPKPDPSEYAAIWARVWAWIEFLHTYKLHLRDLPAEEELYFGFMLTISHIQAQWDEQLISSTPGLCAVVARSWVVFLEGQNSAGIRNTCQLLSRTKALVGTPEMDEFIDGTGGTVDALAATVVRHINIATTGHAPIGSAGIFMLMAVANFLHTTTSKCCTSPPCYPWITGALQAGLLRAIASSAMTGSNDALRHLSHSLESIIPNALVYRSALGPMPEAILDVQKLVDTRAFRNSGLYQPWLTFQEHVNERVNFLSLFVSESYVAYKGCDNVLVRITASSEYELFTLDKNTSSSDVAAVWNSITVHRSANPSTGKPDTDTCARPTVPTEYVRRYDTHMHSKILRIPLGDPLVARDLSFLRELGHTDFIRNLVDILSQVIDETSITGKHALPVMTMKYMGGSSL
ncbi:hypothetical protein DFH06DRAFT_1123457 [Mycena polygramma]|nr:hypothetical protein DFH06DRAFT_1123457 [Mycena polygramma]